MSWFRCSILALLISSATWALPTIQVVQSVPLETNIGVGGILETTQAWLGLIRAATKSIDIEQFYISSQPGQPLESVLNEIRAAAARGVKVRIIVDSKFYQNYSSEPKALAQVKNIEVKVIDYSSHGGVQHAKFFIVDQRMAYVGSANFDWLALSHIHETGVVIADANVAVSLGLIFDRDWDASRTGLRNRGFESFRLKDSTFTVVASPSTDLPEGVSETLDGLLDLISKAKTSISVQMYQYSTRGNWTVLEKAMKAAAARGVKVRMMFDQATLKNGAAALGAFQGVKNVEIRISRIPQWSGGPLQYARLSHSKYMLVDHQVSWIGSENWSESYFTSTRNVGLLIEDASVTAQADQIFEKVWSSPYVSAL
jgi:phosphatidylserine/phosphatidylglycerophosphate/cardiolipin synthase-like enzyme